MIKRVCIFGANGYIGRHLAQNLSSAKRMYSLRLCDVHASSFDQHTPYCQVDVRDSQAVREQINQSDYVFFFAGLTNIGTSFDKFREFVEINEIGLLNVLDACRQQEPRPKVVFPSSRLVYKGKKDVALKEDDEKEINTLYALNKFAGEQYLRIYANCFGIKYVVFRICVPYGSMLQGKQSYGTISHFISQAKQKGEVIVFGDGSQKRTFTHIYDLVQILLEASFSPVTDNDTFNIGGPDSLTIRYVAGKIALKYGARLGFAPWPELAEKIESGDTVFCSAKLDSLLKVRYRYTFEDWLRTEEVWSSEAISRQ